MVAFFVFVLSAAGVGRCLCKEKRVWPLLYVVVATIVLEKFG